MELDERLTRVSSEVDRALHARGLLPGESRRALRKRCVEALDEADLAGRDDLANEILARLVALGGVSAATRVRWARLLLLRGWTEGDLPVLAFLSNVESDPRSVLALGPVERRNLDEAIAQIRLARTPFARAACALLGRREP